MVIPNSDTLQKKKKMTNTKAIKNGSETVTDNAKNEEISKNEVAEFTTIIDEQKIGYCRYGVGKHIMLFICGAVGKFKLFFFFVIFLTNFY